MINHHRGTENHSKTPIRGAVGLLENNQGNQFGQNYDHTRPDHYAFVFVHGFPSASFTICARNSRRNAAFLTWEARGRSGCRIGGSGTQQFGFSAIEPCLVKPHTVVPRPTETCEEGKWWTLAPYSAPKSRCQREIRKISFAANVIDWLPSLTFAIRRSARFWSDR